MDPQQLESCTDAEFLDLLAERWIELRIHDEKLRISAPAGTLNDALKSELARRKTTLLERIRAADAQRDRAPLSYAQERLWVLERFHPGNFAYNIPEPFEVHTAVDRGLMQRAIDFVVQRHAVLRTSIREDQHGRAMQQIHEHVATPLQFLDYRKLNPAAKTERLQRVLRGLSREPFDLRVAPLVRFFLIQLEAEHHVVFVNIHHIVSDRWSTGILIRELMAAYEAYAQGGQPGLKPLPLQYADYARRERAPEPSEKSEEQLRYWMQQLADAPDPTELPFQRRPTVLKPFDGAISLVELTQEDTAGLRALARANGASPYMVLLAAYTALLHRYTGATDVCIGSPVSERTSTDTEALIGLFVNTLVMRCTVPHAATFADLLRSVRETVLDAQANHEVPLQRIFTELQRTSPPGGGPATQPIFQTMLAFDAYMGGAKDEPSALTQVAVDPGFAKFELTLQMWESRDRIGGWFEYRTDLFTADAMARFSQALILLLRDAIREPQKAVAKLDIVPQAERERLLHTWNDTAMDFPRDRTIHRLFEEQVERTPDAVAVIDGTRRIPYRELNRMANRVAHGLLARGIGAETIVGVQMGRSTAMIVAMLGILKAGAAYLPLDANYPEERLRFMAEDSGCALVLSDSSESVQVSAADMDQNPSIAVAPSNLAYVIYTSGSTGRPKGVAIEHHSTVSFLHWGKATFPPEVLRGTLASTSISFDLSIFEIFLPLICGHSVILASDVLALPSLPAAAEVTLVNTVPSAAAALLGAKGIPKTVRAINLAGEPLPTRLLDRLYKETTVTDVNDLYGPTETTTYSTWNRRSPGRAPTIGRPLANTRVYLVDASLELVPEGVPGELLIAGEGVARGYLGRRELTAEKFVSLAHLGEIGTAYRTGDLCRYAPDGVLEYLGRMDSQVKVRGFRIELGEVEATLTTHPHIREAVATVQAEGDGVATLAAAVVLQEGHTLDVPALIAHQAKVLPAHMVARNIFVLDQLPRTANGKIDRKRLAADGVALRAKQPAKAVAAPPRDPLERELTSIWQEGFSIPSIGIDDDFFQLGGHSLLALRIFSEIEARLGCRMMLSVLFQAPTIRQLAEHIRREQAA